MIMALMGTEINLEVLSDKDRVDGVLEMGKLIYIIEFKMDSPLKALEQIKKKKYYESYLNCKKEIYLLGVGGFKEKKIECLVERL
jgi:hypothetical protein